MLLQLTAAHVPAATALLGRAGLASGVANFARYLQWQSDCAWGLFEGESLIGIVTLLRFGIVGFVGCMAVEPQRQGGGHGRRLLDHAHGEGERHGVATFLLEATLAGELLYGRCGYVSERVSVVLERKAERDATSGDPRRGDEAIATAGAPIDAGLFSLDQEATGSDRGTMLWGLSHETPVELMRATSGELHAFGMRVGTRLGPLVCRDASAGRELVARLEPGCGVTGVAERNEAAIAAYEEHGFAQSRHLRRMRRGPVIPSRPSWIWAMASAGSG